MQVTSLDQIMSQSLGRMRRMRKGGHCMPMGPSGPCCGPSGSGAMFASGAFFMVFFGIASAPSCPPPPPQPPAAPPVEPTPPPMPAPPPTPDAVSSSGAAVATDRESALSGAAGVNVEAAAKALGFDKETSRTLSDITREVVQAHAGGSTLHVSKEAGAAAIGDEATSAAAANADGRASAHAGEEDGHGSARASTRDDNSGRDSVAAAAANEQGEGVTVSHVVNHCVDGDVSASLSTDVVASDAVTSMHETVLGSVEAALREAGVTDSATIEQALAQAEERVTATIGEAQGTVESSSATASVDENEHTGSASAGGASVEGNAEAGAASAEASDERGASVAQAATGEGAADTASASAATATATAVAEPPATETA